MQWSAGQPLTDASSNAAGPKAEATASKGIDFKADRDAVADAAGVSAGLWLSYLFVLFYLLVAVGGVTHRDLFLESPVKLPFLGVDLPLEGFFWLGPLLFLVVHAYVLLHFVLLADRVRVLDTHLEQIGSPIERAGMQRQLPINSFVQLFAGPREVCGGPTGVLLLAITWISLVFGPVALLIFFQLQFLPFHEQWITWLQRTAVVADLALLWWFWPAVIRSEPMGTAWRGMGWGAAIAMTGVTLVAVPLIAIATFPGEALEGALPFFQLRQALIAGTVDKGALGPKGLFFNRLVLPGLNLFDQTKFDTAAKIAAAPVTAPLFRARHLEGAVFDLANLGRADFTQAHLEGASFEYVQLQGAYFSDAQLQGASFYGARLQGASFNRAQLQGASLANANLQGAMLLGAQLLGASLDLAQLQGASLTGADLRRASLAKADLRGANLYKAWLQGASFANAQLRGTSLEGAFMWKTDFRNVKLEAPGVRTTGVEVGPTLPSCEGPKNDGCDPANTPDRLKQTIERYMPDGEARARALARLAPSLGPGEPRQDNEISRSWIDLMVSHEARETRLEQDLENLWREIACAAEGAPFVIMAMLGAPDDPNAFRLKHEQLHGLAAALLNENCAAKSAIPEFTAMQLKGFADAAHLPAARLATKTTER